MNTNLLKIIYSHLNQSDFGSAMNLLNGAEDSHKNDSQYWELLAITHGLSGNDSECQTACLKAIQLNPDNIGTYINLGVAQQNLGLLDEAEGTLLKAMNMNSNHPQVQNNLGAVYILKNQYENARPYIEKAVFIDPNYADALSNLGEIYKRLQEYDKAIDCYTKSIKLNNRNANAYIGLGTLYFFTGDLNKAKSFLNEAIKLNPYNTEAQFNLGFLHYLNKSYNVASHFFRETLKIDPDHENAKYLLSAISSVNSPEKSPQEYVKNLFDYYADTFEKHLVSDLGYSVPEKMRMIFTDNAFPLKTQYLLDLGCGTGICGEKFYELYTHLTGIDLAEKMIAKASDKKIYDELHILDIEEFIKSNSIKYDLVIAADVFIYIGNIYELIQMIHNSQENGGYFIFSIEKSLNHDTFHLRTTGRYSHSESYIDAALNSASYKIIRSEPTIVRNEKGNGIEGIIYLCQK